MEIPSICRYCGGKIIKSTTRALYPKGREPIYLCVNCNAYVGCYPDGRPMGKVANTVLRLKRHTAFSISSGKSRGGAGARLTAGWRAA